MKIFRSILCFCIIAALAAGCVPAMAMGYVDERFEDKTWDEVVADFFAQYDIDPTRVSLGYYNTVSGETHYHNGDQYRVAGSMYKVALNMYWAEKLYLGEIDWEERFNGVDFKRVQEWTILNSDNNYAAAMFEKIGNYRQYREEVAHFYGEDPATVDKKYYENNFSTAEQIIYCLKMLYNEPERYPNVLELMKQAEPERWFNTGDTTYDIAQKFGYVSDESGTFINSCGIVYTDDPILIVMFTCNVSKADERLGDFCDLMADYAQYQRPIRLMQEEAARLAAEAEAKRLAEEEARRLEEEARRLAEEEALRKAEEEAAAAAATPEPVATPVPEVPADTPSEENPMGYLAVAGLSAVGLAVLLIAHFRRHKVGADL